MALDIDIISVSSESCSHADSRKIIFILPKRKIYYFFLLCSQEHAIDLSFESFKFIRHIAAVLRSCLFITTCVFLVAFKSSKVYLPIVFFYQID